MAQDHHQQQQQNQHVVVDIDERLATLSTQTATVMQHQESESCAIVVLSSSSSSTSYEQQPSASAGMIECRICQEEDETANLEIPCACCGSLKYAHRKCVQRWCNEKGDTTCEICQKPFKNGYTAPPLPHRHHHDNPTNGEWQIEIGDPRVIAMAAAAQRRLFQDYEEYSTANGVSCCRSTALILMALLLLRHTLSISASGGELNDEDIASFFTLFLVRAAGFMLPCYILARALNLMQRRRQQRNLASILDASSLLTSRI